MYFIPLQQKKKHFSSILCPPTNKQTNICVHVTQNVSKQTLNSPHFPAGVGCRVCRQLGVCDENTRSPFTHSTFQTQFGNICSGSKKSASLPPFETLSVKSVVCESEVAAIRETLTRRKRKTHNQIHSEQTAFFGVGGEEPETGD